VQAASDDTSTTKSNLFAEVIQMGKGQTNICAVTKLMDSDEFSDEDREDLLRLLSLPPKQVPATWIAKALAARGTPISAGTIKTHRRGDCSCDQTR